MRLVFGHSKNNIVLLGLEYHILSEIWKRANKITNYLELRQYKNDSNQSQYKTSTSLHRYEVKLFSVTFREHKKYLFGVRINISFVALVSNEVTSFKIQKSLRRISKNMKITPCIIRISSRVEIGS